MLPAAMPELSAADKRAIERYHRLINDARELILRGDMILTIADVDALNLFDDDWIDVIQGLSIEQTAAFIIKLIEMARG